MLALLAALATAQAADPLLSAATQAPVFWSAAALAEPDRRWRTGAPEPPHAALDARLSLEPPRTVTAAWWAAPAASELRPVAPRYLLHHRELMALYSAGPGAAPAFRNAWSRMETHWTLVNNNQPGLVFSEGEEALYRDLTLVSAQRAGQALVQELIDGSELLSVVTTTARMLTSPAIEIRPSQGEIALDRSLGANRPELQAAAIQDVARADAEEREAIRGAAYAAQRRGAWDPTIRFGGTSGLRAASAGDAGDVGDIESLEMSLDLGGYLELRRIGVDAMRLSASVARYPLDAGELAWGDRWILSARESLRPGWVAALDLRSNADDLRPDRLRPMLSWRVPGAQGWFVQPSWTWTFPEPDRPDGEHLAMLRLTWLGRWHMPTDPARWPLGKRPNAGGPEWPVARATDANVAAPLVRYPVFEAPP